MVAKSNANNWTNEEKIKVQEAYSQFQTILEECVASISKLHNTDDRFFSLQQDYLSLLKDKIRESRYLLDNAMKYQEWDNLVIAFFGMTNAGKSTIIETFRILFDEVSESFSHITSLLQSCHSINRELHLHRIFPDLQAIVQNAFLHLHHHQTKDQV